MRKLSALIGTLLALLVMFVTFFHAGVEVKYFINMVGLFIVVGGFFSKVFS